VILTLLAILIAARVVLAAIPGRLPGDVARVVRAVIPGHLPRDVARVVRAAIPGHLPRGAARMVAVAIAGAGYLPRDAVAAVDAGLCLAAALLAAATLAGGAHVATLTLPFGPVGGGMHFVLDPLAASFLLLLFAVMPWADGGARQMAAVAITVLAGDGFTLVLGLLLSGGAALRRPAAAAAVCLIVAFALAGPVSDFAMIRAAPPEGWRAATLLVLVLAGATALSSVSPAMAIYLPLRVLLDLCGPTPPPWWSVPLLLVGAAMAILAAWRAALAATLHAAVSHGSLHQVGLAMVALGVTAFARAVDLPSVAARALAGAWLALVCHVLCRALLVLCADAFETGAGTRRLTLLGGLIHRMPVTAGCCLVGLAGIAALPPGLGFAALWLVIQSLIATARFGDFGLQVLVICVVAVSGLSGGLAALAAVRLAGVGLLGRPRAPRSAAAEEVFRPRQLVLGGLALLVGLLGLLPAFALLPIAGWDGAAQSISWLSLRADAEAPGYSPIAVTVLFGAAGLAIIRWLPRSTERRREPAWSGGFAAPPPWLPFGDTATQYGPASFSEPLCRALAPLRPTEAFTVRCKHWRDVVLRVATALVTL
jgi:formate hydrogenlyase subunit 3/multisubunit Na+/H+ antiporter MnhD subunit